MKKVILSLLFVSFLFITSCNLTNTKNETESVDSTETTDVVVKDTTEISVDSMSLNSQE